MKLFDAISLNEILHTLQDILRIKDLFYLVLHGGFGSVWWGSIGFYISHCILKKRYVNLLISIIGCIIFFMLLVLY